ncbi:SHOCT domain-containing protein [Salinactinospora qingdaonensis]|uniref:SHOCT domain-containing protein n=1 Tax=Salinactinospora qingdaonensis TaxID=702744 RepID=A0ABP7GJR0_9ACTN
MMNNAWLAVTMFLFWILLIVAIVALLRSMFFAERSKGEQRSEATPGSAAEQTLAERFARGDIDEEEYNNRLATLRATPAGRRKP